jgi:hypothetical protein
MPLYVLICALQQSEEDEAKPFLSAFLQSSVPDEIFADFRLACA